jgi:hypothetical protein
MTIDRLNTGPVNVEHSDERLAAVEEAKRTGNEFRSVGSKGNDLVAREKVVVATQEWSNEDASETSPLPVYLEELDDSVDQAQHRELNVRKAKEHSDYSADLVAKQQDADEEARENLRKDPLYYVKLIQERNLKSAEEFQKNSEKYAKQVVKRADAVDQERRSITAEEASSDHPLTVMGQKAEVTDISESLSKDGLEAKDRIIYGEESFKAEAKRNTDRVVKKVPKARKADEPQDADKPENVNDAPESLDTSSSENNTASRE